MGSDRVFMAQQLRPALCPLTDSLASWTIARLSNQTLNLLRPLALLLLITALPALVFIRRRKPWVLFRFMLLG
jgi:hypothetical protein